MSLAIQVIQRDAADDFKAEDSRWDEWRQRERLRMSCCGSELWSKARAKVPFVSLRLICFDRELKQDSGPSASEKQSHLKDCFTWEGEADIRRQSSREIKTGKAGRNFLSSFLIITAAIIAWDWAERERETKPVSIPCYNQIYPMDVFNQSSSGSHLNRCVSRDISAPTSGWLCHFSLQYKSSLRWSV